MKRVGVFPGSFDPIHNGHVDLIRRGRLLFDELVLGVLHNDNKKPLFAIEERCSLLEELFEDDDGIRVVRFSGLLVDLARQVGADTILRGLRSGTDLDYELPMTFMNRRMAPLVETVFLMTSPGVADLSSSLIKDIYRLGGAVDSALPSVVEERLREKLQPKLEI